MPNESLPSPLKVCWMPTIAYSKKCQILTFICLALIAVIFQRGLQLGLVNSVTDRIRFHAIPVAVSFLYHGHPHDYTALRDVAIPFQGPGPLRELLADSVNKKVTQKDTYYWVADDKGFGDFVIVAFKLFGPKTSSMYLMWFVCLIFSTTLFLKGFSRRLWCLSLLGMALLGVYTAISTLPLADETNFINFQGSGTPSTVSIYEVRFLDVLAMVPVIHICLFAMRRSLATSGWQIAALIGQVGLFFFLYHARSSLGWQLVAMIGFLSLIVVYRLWRSRKKQVKSVTRFLRPAFVLATLVTCLITLSIYKHASYNPRYFQDMGARTFWHNAVMGLSEPGIAEKYQLRGTGDAGAVLAILGYAQQSTCQSSVVMLDLQGLLSSLGGHGEKNWPAYEDCAKKFYFSLWRDHKLRMIYNYFVENPRKVLVALWGVAKSPKVSLPNSIREQFAIGWHPFAAVPFMFACLILFIAQKTLYQRRMQLMALLGVLLAASLIPAISFYAVILTLGGFFVTLTIICYFLFLITVRGLVRWLYARPNKMTT